ncbi:hypothetical protein V6N12_023248 [Hibiscus sabdariffa]|uniref:Uncharacterized protein n=1 Tax=Hibiscus sabdariffa TaxID=183260 RepID=A0ABR2FX52_9ROSI
MDYSADLRRGRAILESESGETLWGCLMVYVVGSGGYINLFKSRLTLMRRLLSLDWEVKFCKINCVCNRAVDTLTCLSRGLPVSETIFNVVPCVVLGSIQKGF